METVLFGSFLTQYDAVKATFKEMKPFLNISGETERYYSRVVILKILFIVYAFDEVVPKPLSLTPRHIRYFSTVCIKRKEIRLSILSAFLIILFYKGPLKPISAEFLIDIFMVIFSLNYAVEAYKREVQKISAVIFICLYVHWYTNHTASTEDFRFRTYFKIIALLFLSYLPMMPNNRKYRHRLAYLYLIISIVILYKLNQHCNGHQYVMHQNKTTGSIGQERQIELDLQRGKLMDTLKNLDINDENIHSDAENVESSCYTVKKVVPNKPLFPRNPEQITKEKVAKLTSNSKAIQNEDTRNAVKRDASGLNEVKKDENAKSSPETLKVHDAKTYQLSGSQNKNRPDDAVFKLPEAVHTNLDSTSDESSNTHGKFIDDEMHKNLQGRTENKEANGQSGRSLSLEVPKSGYESTAEATGEEKDATGKFANRKDEACESTDASYKPGGKKILNGKRTVLFFKKRGEINKGNKIKKSGHRRKLKGNESGIQKSMNSKNEILAIFGSNKKGTDVGIRTKTAHLSYRKLSPLKTDVKTERKGGTELQIRNSGVVKGRLMKPERVRTVNSVKNLLSVKPIVKRLDKKKDLLTIGNDSPVKNSKD